MSTRLQPGDPIPLDAGQLEALGSQVMDLTQEAERQHATYISDIATHWDWYNAKPDVARRSLPWPGASNVVVPFIRSQCDSLASRAVLQLFSSDKTWALRTENELFDALLPDIARFLNRSANRPFSMFTPWESAITEQYIIGEAVVAQEWSTQERHLIPPRGRRPIRVLEGQGPRFYHRPREQWLWDRTNPIEESQFVIEQAFYSEGDLIRHTQIGDERNRWDRARVEDVLGQRGIEGPVADVRARKLKATGVEVNLSSLLEPHDVRQVRLDWPFFSSLDRRLSSVPNISHILSQEVEDVRVPVILILHRRTGTILRANYSPYLTTGWPLYTLHYRKLSGVNQGSHGIAKIGEHIQRGLTTLINQSIDAVTLANSLKVITTDKNFASRPFVPNQIPLVGDVSTNTVRELSAQKQLLPDIALANLLQATGERTVGQGDPNLGRETRMGGHPQPATNFIGLLQQAQILNTRPMKSIRNAISRAGEHRATFYQQFERDSGGWIARTFGPEDGARIRTWLDSEIPTEGNVVFDAHALSEIHNPQEERQKAVLVQQMTNNYVIQIAKYLEVAGNPQTTEPMKQLMAFAIEANGKAMTKFLESSDIDNVEDYVFELQQQQGDARALIAQLAQRVGALQPQADGNPGPLRGNGMAALQGGGPSPQGGNPGGGGAGSLA